MTDSPARPAVRGDIRKVRWYLNPQNCDALAEARRSLQDNEFAVSTTKSARSRLKLWSEICRGLDLPPFPVTTEALESVGAVLKASGYRSAVSYLDTAVSANSRKGFTLTQVQREALRRIKRSLKRGLGAPRRARPVTPADLYAMSRNCRRPREKMRSDAYTLAAWFLLRGGELCCLRMQDVITNGSSKGCGWVEVTVSSSKVDIQGLGQTRKHGCGCAAEAGALGRHLCPVRAAGDLLQARRAQGAGQSDLLVGDLFGADTGKDGLKEVLRDDLAAAGITLAREYSMHSLRRGGCQILARAGLDRSQIRAFGRWAKDSSCVDIYIEDALLARSNTFAKEGISAEVEIADEAGWQGARRALGKSTEEADIEGSDADDVGQPITEDTVVIVVPPIPQASTMLRRDCGIAVSDDLQNYGARNVRAEAEAELAVVWKCSVDGLCPLGIEARSTTWEWGAV
ncbi:hypothetical protein FOZ63_021243 [Perkinsus olseni]|uniref:Tyr recombinase domain-containing protein n=1 Tax=Perkinsus olseni TaxID=32597 RepID=A0A7J6UEB8_PEROL|nr:hypothetical protein FOZ63_021243 [Perkinsus olseni]